MPEIQPADREAAMPVETMTAMEMSTALLAGLMVLGDPIGECPRPVIGRYQMLKSSEIIDLVRRKHIIPCHRSYIARIIELLTTTPPEPRALTAEIVREMLPMQGAEIDGNSLALYKSPLGAWISWTHHRGEFSLKLNDRTLDMSRLTDRNLAALIAAFGIDAGVKHG